MENRRFFVIGLCLFAMAVGSKAQIIFNNQCNYNNSAVLSEAIMEYIDEWTLKEILEKKANLRTLWEVDSLGHIQKYVGVRPLKIEGNYDQLFSKVENKLIKEKKHFYVVYEFFPSKGSYKETYNLTKKDAFSDNKYALVMVFFPGPLVDYYYPKTEFKTKDLLLKQLEEQTEKYNCECKEREDLLD